MDVIDKCCAALYFICIPNTFEAIRQLLTKGDPFSFISEVDPKQLIQPANYFHLCLLPHPSSGRLRIFPQNPFSQFIRPWLRVYCRWCLSMTIERLNTTALSTRRSMKSIHEVIGKKLWRVVDGELERKRIVGSHLRVARSKQAEA